ncbi:unnamed protein product [Strongylus vulgaris]|uniref:Glycosyltransferase family 92 protein n=1 Tax=Strongylus vulgaris TaxID=40348 RepID=A0A3P7JSG9_STRVU|nr:unnamed protein product [Strongylus vulgaris]
MVYCRYFDRNRSELRKAFKSVVFPEYNVHCLRRDGAAFMSLSDTPSGPYEFPVPIIDRTQAAGVSEPDHFFSVCVAPIYGNESKWILLAELIEHYKLQDCLLRARRHSRWIAFIDLDERLTLTNVAGIIYDYLKNISDPSFGGIQFRQRWILKNESSPERYANEDQVLIMNVHFVTKFLKGYRMYRLKPEEGVVR